MQIAVDTLLQQDDRNSLKIAKIVNEARTTTGKETFDQIRARVIDSFLTKSNEGDKIIRSIYKHGNFNEESTNDFITFVEAVSYLAFIQVNGQPASTKIPSDMSLTAQYAAVLKRLHKRVVTLEIKTLPFFNQVTFIDKPCQFFGIQNSIKGGVLENKSIPSFMNGNYRVLGAKHVISSGQAHSEFSLVKDGFDGGTTSVTLGTAIKSRLRDLGLIKDEKEDKPS